MQRPRAFVTDVITFYCGHRLLVLQVHFSKFPFRYAVSVDARDVLIHMKLLEEATRTGRIAVHAELQGLPSGLTGVSLDRSARHNLPSTDDLVRPWCVRDNSGIRDGC